MKKNSSILYAIKTLKKVEIIKLKQVDHVMNEVTLLCEISHQFIVYCYGFHQDSSFLYLVLELVIGGELFTLIRLSHKLEPPHAMFYAAQVAVIFEYLHSLDIIYRDLKPENILIDKSGYLKLTDFGFAKVVKDRTYTLCGTPEYLAPEILLNKGHNKSVDWWTFGVLLFEMIAGSDPFADKEPIKVYKNILKGKLKFPKSFDKNAKSLVKHTLTADLSKRYGTLKNGLIVMKA